MIASDAVAYRASHAPSIGGGIPLFTRLPRETVWKVGRRRLGCTFRRRAAAKQASLALLLASVRCQHGAIRNFQTVSRRRVLGNSGMKEGRSSEGTLASVTSWCSIQSNE